MGNAPQRDVVTARESDFGAFGRYIDLGHPIPGACITMTIRIGADPAAAGEAPHAFGRAIALTGDPAAGHRALPITMARPRPQAAGGRAGSSRARPRGVTDRAGAVCAPLHFEGRGVSG